MKDHRIISAGNSAAVSLSGDELEHLGVVKGQQVTISKALPDRLIIRATYYVRRKKGSPPRSK